MRVTYDPEARAAYIYLVEPHERSGGLARQGGSLEDGVTYDFDRAGRLVGIEVLDADWRLPDAIRAMADGDEPEVREAA